MKFTDMMMHEHEAVRRALTVLQEMADRAERGTMPDRHDVNALLIFFHYYVDESHQNKEETILFPALRRSLCSLQVEAGLRNKLDRLMSTHSDERELIQSTQRQLFSDRPTEFSMPAKKFIRILWTHAAEEEKELFPLAEKVLTTQELEDVSAGMEQADATFGRSQLNLLMQMLQELEKKYLAQAA
jgi:hemerythrin-like domain-containing protein